MPVDFRIKLDNLPKDGLLTPDLEAEIMNRANEIGSEINSTPIKMTNIVDTDGERYPLYQENNTGMSFIILGRYSELGPKTHLDLITAENINILYVWRIGDFYVCPLAPKPSES